MALAAGFMTLTVEFGKDLKDRDWFCRMDPYCVISVGSQVFRSKTANSGGRNPVWNETFKFSIINENDVNVEIKDDDIGRDEYIGSATFTLARARELGSDRINVPVTSKRSNKQHGVISVSLKWTPNTSTSADVSQRGPQPQTVLAPSLPSAPAYAPPAAPAAPPYAPAAPPLSYASAPPPQMVYSQQAPQPMPQPSYGGPQPSYGAPQPSFGIPSQQPGYGAVPPAGYAAPQPAGYGAPQAPAAYSQPYARAPSPVVYQSQPQVVYMPPAAQPPTVIMGAQQPNVVFVEEMPYHHHHHHHRHRDVEVVVVENDPFW